MASVEPWPQRPEARVAAQWARMWVCTVGTTWLCVVLAPSQEAALARAQALFAVDLQGTNRPRPVDDWVVEPTQHTDAEVVGWL